MQNTNEKQTWFKWDYVCSDCDSHIEMTIKSTGKDGHISLCPHCRGHMSLMSVVDVTIEPTKKEETMEATITDMYNPNLLVTYKVIENNETIYKTSKVSELEWDLDLYRQLRNNGNMWWNKESQLRNLIQESYQDASDTDLLEQIAEIFDIPLTKTIEYTATITINGTMEVDLTNTYDLNDMLFSNISIQGDSEVEVSDFDVLLVEEI